MAFFVSKDSIVRRIWAKSDTVLFIFAGASAEFALNKAVDWLYFTGKLPADPLGRMLSTVSYARQIVFSELHEALYAIDKINAIHQNVESARGAKIPDWAYRDVLFMLIDYSIRSYEILERKLSIAEKEEVFDVFYRVGKRMGIADLPISYQAWVHSREEHLEHHLIYGDFSSDLYKQYRKHLGGLRYKLLREAQLLVVPEKVNRLLSLGSLPLLWPILKIYKLSRYTSLSTLIKTAVLPAAYRSQILAFETKL